GSALMSSVIEGEPCFNKSSAVTTLMGSAASSAAPTIYEPVTTTTSSSDVRDMLVVWSCAKADVPYKVMAIASAAVEWCANSPLMMRVDMNSPGSNCSIRLL